MLIRIKYSFILLILLVTPSILALEIQGSLSQGSLVSGYVNPNTKLIFLGRDVRVHKSGLFVFGLGRDAPKEITITIIGSDTKKENHKFSVLQREYNEQRISGVPADTVFPPTSVIDRIKNEAKEVRVARQVDSDTLDFLTGFSMPLEGPITGVYGSRRVYNGHPGNPHYGLDIAAPSGTDIYSPAPGVVELVNHDMFYSGGTLLISHGLGVSSTFIHLSKVEVTVGQRVERGQLIGKVGSSGRATGPHLDWRINWFNIRLDPELILKDFPLSNK